MILFCIVLRIKETYENFKTLVQLTKLNEIRFKFLADLKLILLDNGQQTATATYPCPCCFITLHELKNFDKMVDENHPNNNEENLNLKRYKHLKEDYLQFKSMGNDKKQAKHCHSTVHHPLFIEEDNDEDNDMYALQKCVPPELHLLQGFVNHLFWDAIVKIDGVGKKRVCCGQIN